MASSVARMFFEDWHLHKPSSHNFHTSKSLPKVLTRICPSVVIEGDPISPATTTTRRQSHIFDLWAARETREMVTTIERRAHEAELSALSTTTQPVSARAASFLRETSPDASAAAASSSDIPSSVRASSLIQMWRELEAESGASPTPLASAVDAQPPIPAKDPSGDSDGCDEIYEFSEWENAPSLTSSESSSTGENEATEKITVDKIVRMMSLRITEDERENKRIASAVYPFHSPTPSPALRLRGWQVMKDFISKQAEERRREVSKLADRCPVSRFPFRGSIQSLIRLRSLRQEVAGIKHQQHSQKDEVGQYEMGSKYHFLRRSPQNRSHHDAHEVSNEVMILREVQPPDSYVSGFEIPNKHSIIGNKQLPEFISEREEESSPQAFHSPQPFLTLLSQCEETPQSRCFDASWDERNVLWESIPTWQRPSQMIQIIDSKIAFEGTKMPTKEQQVKSTNCHLLSEPSLSSKISEVKCENTYGDLPSLNLTRNEEILQLRQLKKVSTSLVSEFSVKMNQIIASFLHRQRSQHTNDNNREDHEEQVILRQNYESGLDQDLTAAEVLLNQERVKNTKLWLSSQIMQSHDSWQSVSLPLPFQMLQRQESLQNSSSIMQEEDDMRDLKNSISQMHHAIFELRKMVESGLDRQKLLEHAIKHDAFQIHHEISELKNLFENCLDSCKKLDHSIKPEFLSTTKQLGGCRNLLRNSECTEEGKGVSYISSSETHADSFLYRCDRKCHCYKCCQVPTTKW